MPKKKPTEVTAAMKEAVLLLRYHKKRPEKTDATFMTLAAIANHLDLTVNQVRYICTRHYLQKKRRPKRRSESAVARGGGGRWVRHASFDGQRRGC